MLLKLGLRSVRAHRLRFLLCTVAVVLGVAFVSGSLIFTDTLSNALRRTVAGPTPDLVVTAAGALETGDPNTPAGDARPVTVPSDLADRLAAVQGVEAVSPQLLVGGVDVLGRDGRPIDTFGVTMYGASWPREDRDGPFRLTEGRAPWGSEQLALDQATAKRVGYAVGDRVRVVTPTTTVTATLTGTISPGLSGLAGGAPLIAFDAATAQLVLLGEPGWTSIGVRVAAGQDMAAVQQAVRAAAGPGVRVRTAAEVDADTEGALDQAFGGFGSVLLLFAGIALFVGTFLIVNTFSMLVAQRSRELAMLRAVGASRPQVTRAVVVEALAIGMIGATGGLLLGAGIAGLMQLALGWLDIGVPTGRLRIGVGTIVASYLVGVLVTVLSAYPAARRAGRVPPVAAMRDQVALPPRSYRLRAAGGIALLGIALTGGTAAAQNRGLPAAALVGLSGGCGLAGMILAGPLISRPAIRLLTVPFARRTPDRLGRQNAQRNPRRTAATASALMVTLALVSGLAVVASSVKASIDDGVRKAFGTADLVVTGTSGNSFGPAVADRVRDTDGVVSVGRMRTMPGQVGDDQLEVAGADPAVLDGPISTEVEAGELSRLGQAQAVLPRNLADALGVRVDENVVLVTRSGTYRLTVGAIVAPNRQLNAIVTSLDTFRRIGGGNTDSTLYVEVGDDVDPAAVQRRVSDALADQPTVEVRDQRAYVDQQRGPVDVLVGAVYLMLALAVLIAILGIVNTLALSVVERTREIGLLRVIGMERGQLARMIRVESVAIALLGAVLGLLVGVSTGLVIQYVMADDGIGVLDVPVLQLLVAVLLSGLVGVLAALFPARRAARQNPLEAIAVE
jgi:putative ABC transport system permease protein